MNVITNKIEKWFGLQEMCCVVAGANGLIGKASCKALLDLGAEVVGVDLKDPKLEGLEFHAVNLTEPEAVAEFFLNLEKRDSRSKKKGYAFVNCAYPRTENWGKLGFENVSLEDWNENVRLQLGSFFQFAQAAVRFLMKVNPPEGGVLVHFGSIYGELGPDLKIYEGTPIQNPSPYAAIKAGMGGLTRYLATTYAQKGIRANLICPGGVFQNQPESFVKAYSARTPMGRMASPEEIASVVGFLCGPGAKYINGQTLLVDGGWSAW